jgi:hypothetical protein
MDGRRIMRRRLRFQTHISWIQILIFIVPYATQPSRFHRLCHCHRNGERRKLYSELRGKSGSIIILCSVPVKPDVMSVRPVRNRSAMDPVLLQTSVGRVLSSDPLPEFHRRYAPVWNSWHIEQCIYRYCDVIDLWVIPLSWIRRRKRR